MEAKETIEQYLSELLTWETDRYSKVRTPDYRGNLNGAKDAEDRKSKEILQRIIEKFLTKKAAETIGKPSLVTMAVGRPAVYDQSVVDVIEDDNKFFVVCESNNGALLGSFIRYSLKQEGGHWKIDRIDSSPDRVTWRKNHAI